MPVAHAPWIVALSIVVAVQGAYVALGLALRIGGRVGLARRLTLAAAAASFALATWSMHFVGMLALRLPTDVDYLVLPTLLSLLVCVVVVGAAMFLASLSPLGTRSVPVAAAIMGAGIVSMHYLGMMALHGSVAMTHAPAYALASFAVAVAASWLGLRFAFAAGAGLPRAAAALVLGLAISGMHYVAMAGTTFAPPDAMPLDHGTAPGFVLSQDVLALVVAVVAFLVSGVFLLTLVPEEGPAPVAPAMVPAPVAAPVVAPVAAPVTVLPLAAPVLEPPPSDPPQPAFTAAAPTAAPAVAPAPAAVATPATKSRAAPGLALPLGGVGGPTLRSVAASLPVQRNGGTAYLPVEQIVFVQADTHYTSVFDGRSRLFCPLSIGEVERRLDPARFLRVHRSYLVAIDRIAGITRAGDGGTARFATEEPATVPISRARFPALKALVEDRTRTLAPAGQPS